ncbi:type II restriction endonuclease [Lichenihabitans psoromatis]|uniref:type II restriction endonuclease n=1 Tax=Lichenihabitans psoromatis TaxID=2528642 RepID=UPI00315CEC7D
MQEGVPETQFGEMVNAGVQLVVPAGLTDKSQKSVQPHLQSLQSFIGDVRLLSVSRESPTLTDQFPVFRRHFGNANWEQVFRRLR